MLYPALHVTQVPARGVPKPPLLRLIQELPGTDLGADGVEQRPRGCVDPPLLFPLLLDGIFDIPRHLDVSNVIERATNLSGGVDGNGKGDWHEGREQEWWWWWRRWR